MSGYRAVQDLIDVLRAIPNGVVPTSRIGSVSPTKKNELPSIVVTLSEAAEAPIGVGRLEAVTRVSDDEWSEGIGIRTKGLMGIQVLGEGSAAVETIAGRVADVLIDPAEWILKGFLKVSLEAVGAIGETGLGRSQNVPAFGRVLQYAVVHEHISRSDPGVGGVIDEIHVDMHDQFHESFDVP